MVRSSQVSPSQQPLGQLRASQMHRPLTHRWPGSQALPVPHTQAPSTQPSAFVGLHAMQLSPARPQVASPGSWHVAPEQHPLAQVRAQPEHCPAWHPSPGGQATHGRPALPHAEASSPRTQAFSRQQPSGHDSGVQRHSPSTHSSPGPQLPPQGAGGPSSTKESDRSSPAESLAEPTALATGAPPRSPNTASSIDAPSRDSGKERRTDSTAPSGSPSTAGRTTGPSDSSPPALAVTLSCVIPSEGSSATSR